tara:strand:- start:361 stop:486 length:126 start_codon:yes stop_codon:yes gene_type:complete
MGECIGLPEGEKARRGGSGEGFFFQVPEIGAGRQEEREEGD